MSNLNINQQSMTPVVGLLAMELPAGGVISGQVSANQATALVPGQFVKLDTTITAGSVLQFVAAAQGDKAYGFLPFNVKTGSFTKGDRVEVVRYGVVYLQNTSAAAITQGAQVESDTTGLLIEALNSGSLRGVSLDYIPASGVGRVEFSRADQAHA